MSIPTIIINSRGIKYEVILETLNKYLNTRLGKLYVEIKNKNYEEIANLCDRYNDDLNEFYFNRDPYVLNMILNYYQTEKFHLNYNQCVLFVKSELIYWGIEEYLLESCCQTFFSDKLEDLTEIIQLENQIIETKNHLDDFGKCLFPKLRENIWNLFNEPKSSNYAKLLFYLSIIFIMISISISSKFLKKNVYFFLLKI